MLYLMSKLQEKFLTGGSYYSCFTEHSLCVPIIFKFFFRGRHYDCVVTRNLKLLYVLWIAFNMDTRSIILRNLPALGYNTPLTNAF